MYPFDGKLVKASIDESPIQHFSVRQVRDAAMNNMVVVIYDDALIFSPYCLHDEGHVVYFNIRTPTEYWGRCSKTGKRVIWRRKSDKYILERE